MAGQSSPPGNDDTLPVVRRTDIDGTESLSTEVMLTLDSLPDFDAQSSDDALFEHVNPDALDTLFRSPLDGNRGGGWVSFPVGDYEVSVSARGEIVVRAHSD